MPYYRRALFCKLPVSLIWEGEATCGYLRSARISAGCRYFDQRVIRIWELIKSWDELPRSTRTSDWDWQQLVDKNVRLLIYYS